MCKTSTECILKITDNSNSLEFLKDHAGNNDSGTYDQILNHLLVDPFSRLSRMNSRRIRAIQNPLDS